MIPVLKSVRESFFKYSKKIFEDGIFSCGANTVKVETLWSDIYGKSIVTSSGTSALELIANTIVNRVNKLPIVVMIPTMTMPAVQYAFRHVAVRDYGDDIAFIIVYVDINPRDGCISIDTLKKAYTNMPNYEFAKVLVVVHNGGVIPDSIFDIVDFCNEHDILLVEDCSHAHGCSYNDHLAGAFGDYAAWSFYPTKVLIAAEGGIARFKEQYDYEYALKYANQGKRRDSGIFELGIGNNYRASEFSAALMRAEIEERIDIFADRRRMLDLYSGQLPTRLLQSEQYRPGLHSTCYKYTMLFSNRKIRDEVVMKLRKVGLNPTGYCFDFSLKETDNSKRWVDCHLNLPFERFMDESRANDVVDKVSYILEEVYHNG